MQPSANIAAVSYTHLDVYKRQDVAHRFIQVAVVAEVRIADHALDHGLICARRDCVCVVARVQRGGLLCFNRVELRARVERRLHLRLVLRQRHAAETCGGRERRPGVDDGVRVGGDALWIAWHNLFLLTGGAVWLIPRASRRLELARRIGTNLFVPDLSLIHIFPKKHVASRTYENVVRQATCAVKNLILVMNGEKPIAQVNPEVPVKKVP